MIVHMLSVHSIQLPVDKIVAHSLDSVEHGQGKFDHVLKLNTRVDHVFLPRARTKHTCFSHVLELNTRVLIFRSMSVLQSGLFPRHHGIVQRAGFGFVKF